MSVVGKTDLIKSAAANAGLSQDTVAQALDGITDAIAGNLAGGHEVRVTGFGTFKTRTASGTAPSGDDYSTVVASFKAGSGLKEKLNA